MTVEATFNLKEFKVSNRWWDDMWGVGHTVETDPTQRGWRAALTKKDGLVLVVGRRGVPRCFSVMQRSSALDVCYYEETPEEVARAINEKRHLNGDFTHTQNIPGWALPMVQSIERIDADERQAQVKP